MYPVGSSPKSSHVANSLGRTSNADEASVRVGNKFQLNLPYSWCDTLGVDLPKAS